MSKDSGSLPHILFGLGAACAIGVVVYLNYLSGTKVEAPPGFIPTVELVQKKISVTSGVERWYTNDERTFSFRLPDGFSAPDLATGEPGVTGVSVEKEGQDQLVVLVYHVAPLSQITIENVRESLSNASITGVREIVVHTVVRGLMFRTEAGFEVWMIHNARLYRITTSAQNEDLLQFILSNWYFAPPTPQKPR